MSPESPIHTHLTVREFSNKIEVPSATLSWKDGRSYTGGSLDWDWETPVGQRRVRFSDEHGVTGTVDQSGTSLRPGVFWIEPLIAWVGRTCTEGPVSQVSRTGPLR